TSACFSFSLHDALPICKDLFEHRLAQNEDRFEVRRVDLQALRACVDLEVRVLRLERERAVRKFLMKELFELRDPHTLEEPEDPRSEEHTSELQSRFDLV